MEFGDGPFCARLPASFLAPKFAEDGGPLEGCTPRPSGYGTVQLEAGGPVPGSRGVGFALEGPVPLVPGTGHSAFSRVRPSPDQNRGARLVRVDPQARQRHGSGSFGPGSGGGTGRSLRQASPEDTRLRACAPFEEAWPVGEAGCGRREQVPVAGAASSSSSSSSTSARDLNYMDLDLGRVLKQPEWSFLRPRSPLSPSQRPAQEGSGYASVSFQRRERVSGDPAHREE
ncbi:hypothetical protein ANANG_G00129150 [Anguilla anguilla]|uniref:Uncharacterized protein n=1 Tax=Anguilla anguilla TaxID=7936 RepID=A0A9D3MGR2_ANGAN|nr:hypothetical protein ANANG_G00129150 [Anguilla anguilla]